MLDRKKFILHIPPEKADEQIELRIANGESLLNHKVKDIQQWKSEEKKFKVWNSENFELLKSIFKNNRVAKDYSSSGWSIERILIASPSSKSISNRVISSVFLVVVKVHWY